MTEKQKALAGDMLASYAAELQNAGCNDWEWPADWTPAECVDFALAYHEWERRPRKSGPDRR